MEGFSVAGPDNTVVHDEWSEGGLDMAAGPFLPTHLIPGLPFGGKKTSFG